MTSSRRCANICDKFFLALSTLNSDFSMKKFVSLQILMTIVGATIADVSHILQESTTYPPRPYQFSYEAGRAPGHTDSNLIAFSSNSIILKVFVSSQEAMQKLEMAREQVNICTTGTPDQMTPDINWLTDCLLSNSSWGLQLCWPTQSSTDCRICRRQKRILPSTQPSSPEHKGCRSCNSTPLGIVQQNCRKKFRPELCQLRGGPTRHCSSCICKGEAFDVVRQDCSWARQIGWRTVGTAIGVRSHVDPQRWRRLSPIITRIIVCLVIKTFEMLRSSVLSGFENCLGSPKILKKFLKKAFWEACDDNNKHERVSSISFSTDEPGWWKYSRKYRRFVHSEASDFFLSRNT